MRWEASRAAVTGAVDYAAYNKAKSNEKQDQAGHNTAAPAASGQPPTVQPAPSQQAGSRLEIYEEIAKLGELKEKGLISEAEFEREKIRLLD